MFLVKLRYCTAMCIMPDLHFPRNVSISICCSDPDVNSCAWSAWLLCFILIHIWFLFLLLWNKYGPKQEEVDCGSYPFCAFVQLTALQRLLDGDLFLSAHQRLYEDCVYVAIIYKGRNKYIWREVAHHRGTEVTLPK